MPMQVVHTDNKYQNYSFNELWEFIKTNPRNGICLDKLDNITQCTETNLDNKINLNVFNLPNLNIRYLKPSGLLSVFCFIGNSLFREAPPHLAKSLLLDFGTKFMTSLDNRIAGTRFLRKRKNINESMNTLMNLPGILTKDVELSVKLLCQVQNIQAIIISNFSTEKGEEEATAPRLIFSSDPGDWNSQTQTWIFDMNGSWILEQLSAESNMSFSSWLEDKEREGWQIEWPSVDADIKKTDMVNCLKESVCWNPSDEKLKKDVLAPRYSRHRVLKGLRNLSYGVTIGDGADTDTDTGTSTHLDI